MGREGAHGAQGQPRASPGPARGQPRAALQRKAWALSPGCPSPAPCPSRSGPAPSRTAQSPRRRLQTQTKRVADGLWTGCRRVVDGLWTGCRWVAGACLEGAAGGAQARVTGRRAGGRRERKGTAARGSAAVRVGGASGCVPGLPVLHVQCSRFAQLQACASPAPPRVHESSMTSAPAASDCIINCSPSMVMSVVISLPDKHAEQHLIITAQSLIISCSPSTVMSVVISSSEVTIFTRNVSVRSAFCQ